MDNPLPLPPATLRLIDETAIAQAVNQVMQVTDTTFGRAGVHDYTVRFRGQLRGDSLAAYDQLEQAFAPLNVTPLFRSEDGQHVIYINPGRWQPQPANVLPNIILALLTFASVLWTGYAQAGQFGNPWPIAIAYTVCLLGILLAHEFGHYFAARYHKAPVTLPYLIPLPGLIGTLGAVIAMRAPLKNRRVLLDIGIAGPLAGLVIAIPVVLVGLSLSELTTLSAPPPDLNSAEQLVLMEGNSLLYLFLKFVTFGQLLPNPESYGSFGPLGYWLVYFFTGQPFPYGATDVTIHPVAWAGWVGLLVTGLNLVPAGQFDGGHVAFVLFGKSVRYIVWVVVGIMLVAGFAWTGWWLWAGIITFANRRPAVLLDEITELDNTRLALAWFMVLVFVLVFTPVPLVIG